MHPFSQTADHKGRRRWLLSDERGSVAAVTSEAGAVLAINTYDAYGKPGSQNMGRFQYTGQTFMVGTTQILANTKNQKLSMMSMVGK